MASKKGRSLKFGILPLFLVGIIIIGALIMAVGLEDIIQVVSRADPAIYIVALLIQTLALFIWLIKWKLVTQAIDLDVSTRQMFPILLSGIFVNNVIPSARIGGEPLRAYVFARLADIPTEKGFATVAADRVIDAIPLLGIIAVALAIAISTWQLPILIIILLLLAGSAIAIGLFAFIYLCLRPKLAERLAGWLVWKLRWIVRLFEPVDHVQRKMKTSIRKFSRGVLTILRRKRYVAPALTLGTVYWLLFVVRMYVVFLALGQPISFGAVGIAVVIGLLLQVVPIPGGLGVVEGAYVLIFSAAGVPADVALTAALLDRSISFWYMGLISMVGISWSGIKLSRVLRERESGKKTR